MRNLDELDNQTGLIYSDLLIPIIYFLNDQPVICAYLLGKYKNLNTKLCQLFWAIQKYQFKGYFYKNICRTN